MVAGLSGTGLHAMAQRYRDQLRLLGVNVELKETLGTPESLLALDNDMDGAQIAFITGGVSAGIKPTKAESLGLISNSGFWIFYRGSDTLNEMSQLKGKRIAIGTAGSLSKALADRVLPQFGITDENATLLPIPASRTYEAWTRGELDVVWAVAVPEGVLIPRLLKDPEARIMSFPMIDAFVRRNPDLLKVILPRGYIDLEKAIPPDDVTMLGTPVRIMARRDLHPAIVSTLLDVMTRESSGQGTFHSAKEFPNGNDREFPMAEAALQYYKNGPSLLQRHLPLWMHVHVTRLIAIFATVVPLVIFVMTFEPTLFRWIIRARLRPFYRRMRAIDRDLVKATTIEQLNPLKTAVEELEQKCSNLKIPLRYGDAFFSLKTHLNLLRLRLASRSSELKD